MLERGVAALRAATAVRVVRAWSEPMWVAMSDRHPAALGSAVAVADLDPAALCLPSREVDPPLHDAITSALRQAGSGPVAGRSLGTVLNVLIEVGAADRAWTVIPAEQLAGLTSQRIHAAPLDPPLSVDGYVV